MHVSRYLFLLSLLGLGGVPQVDPLAARSKGRSDAPVTVYEMADFQCPACRDFVLTTMPAIERDYIRTGKVRWVFVNFPLSRIHKNAVPAAQVAMCAARQGRFWPVHDALFRRQPEWASLDQPLPVLVALANAVGVRRDSLQRCVDARATVDEIARDAQGSVRAGASATPSFYIEGGLAEGAISTPVFFRILDSIYRAKTGAAPGG